MTIDILDAKTITLRLPGGGEVKMMAVKGISHSRLMIYLVDGTRDKRLHLDVPNLSSDSASA